MTSNRKTLQKSKESWFDKPLNRYIALSGVITSIFIAGFKVGDYKKDLEKQLLLFKKEQDCNIIIQQEKDKCAEYRKEIETKQIESLKQTVEELSKIKGGKSYGK